MKKSFIAITIVLAAIAIVFGANMVRFNDTPSIVFLETIQDVFGGNFDVKITSCAGDDITEDFFKTFYSDFRNGDYNAIWKYTKSNIDSIELISPKWHESFLHGNEKIVLTDGWKYFIDRGVECNGKTKDLEFRLAVGGEFAEEPDTGKILSASVTSVKMECPELSDGWRMVPLESYRNAVFSDNSATFIGVMDYSIEIDDGKTVEQHVYDSDKFMIQFDAFSE